MKATYFAATAIATLALSGTVHAAFLGTINDLETPSSDLPDLPSAFSTFGSVTQETTTDLTFPVPRYRSPYQSLGVLADSSYTQLGGDDRDADAVYNLSGTFLQILWGSPDTTGGSGAGFSGDTSRQWIEFYSAPDAGGTLLDTVTAVDLLDVSTTDGLFLNAVFGPPAKGYAWAEFTNIGGGTGATFESIKLVHEPTAAFEVDGAVVPLPAAAWLMIGGLGAVAAAARHGRKKRAAASA